MAKPRHEAHQGRGFENAGAQRVGENDAAGAQSFDESGNAETRSRVEFERIGEIQIDTAPDHIGPLEASNRTQVDAPVAHGEIAALDQKKTEVAGKIGLFEIGFVERTGGQQANARIGAARHAYEAGAKGLEEGRQALDIHVAIERRKSARHDEPVGQRVASAGGRLTAVADHPPASVRTAAEVDRVKVKELAAGRFHALQRVQEIRAAGDGRGRQVAAGDEPTLAVDVGENGFEQPGSLLNSRGDFLPFRSFDQKRQMAQWPGPFARIAIGTIGDAGVADVPVGSGKAAVDLFRLEFGQSPEEFHPIGPPFAILVDEFVGNVRQRTIIGGQRLEASRYHLHLRGSFCGAHRPSRFRSKRLEDGGIGLDPRGADEIEAIGHGRKHRVETDFDRGRLARQVDDEAGPAMRRNLA